MSMTCRICAHADRAAIDRAIVENESIRDIAGRFQIGRSSVDRHKKHIPKSLAQAKQARQVSESTTLLSRVEKLMSQAERIYERAMASGELSVAPAAAREMRGCLELLAKITGELQTAGSRVAITLTQLNALNIADLSPEQIGALYDRVQAERIREVAAMTDEELERQLADLCAKDGMKLVPITTEEPPLVIDRRL